MFLMLLLAVIFLSCILLDKARRSISVKELRRRARGGKDRTSSVIYKLVAQGGSLDLFLWLVGSVCGAVLFVQLARYSVWATCTVIILCGWLVLSTRALNTQGYSWKIAGYLSIPALKIVIFLHPVLSRFTNRLRPARLHSGIYAKEDLVELIDVQLKQKDNHILAQDLQIARGALTFGDKLVREVMTSLHKTKLVAATDPIGPLLMDELHASGFNIFPVIDAPAKKSSSNIVGTLYLEDVLNHGGAGRVRDVMHSGVHFVKESQNLRDALNELLKNQNDLLIVLNNFEETAGVITLQDVMEQILGSKTEQKLQSGAKVVK